MYVTLIVAGVKQAGPRAAAAGTAVDRLVAFGDFVLNALCRLWAPSDFPGKCETSPPYASAINYKEAASLHGNPLGSIT